MSSPTELTSGRLVEFCDGIVEAGQLAIGVQISIRCGGKELRLTRGTGGTGRALVPESRLRVYCAGKPITAFALTRQLVVHGIDLDEPIGDHLGDTLAGYPPHVARYTFIELLSHATTMTNPVGKKIIRAPDSALSQLMIEGVSRTATGGIGYSEIASWRLLCWAVEAITGRPAEEIIRGEIRDSIGLQHTTVGMTEEVAATAIVEPNVTLQHGERIPMLAEVTPRRLGYFEPGVGTMSTASDLSRFYEWTMNPVTPDGTTDPTSVALLKRMRTHRRERLHDAGFLRDCTFGLGLMVELEDHHYGRSTSPEAYGHSGLIGTAFGFADPAADLAVGVVLVGITDEESTGTYLRPTLVDNIVRTVEG